MKTPKRFVGLLTAISGLSLAACSSQGSTFGTNSTGGAPSASGGGGVTDPGTGGSDVGTGESSSGGASATTGGDVGNTGGSGSELGGGNGLGGSSPGGGAPPVAGSGGVPGAGGVSSMGGSGGAPPTAVCPKPAGQICHEFLANDNSRNEVHYVNEFDPTKNWTVKVGDNGQNSPRGLQVVPNAKAKTGSAALVSIDKGFAEFDLVGGTLLSRVSTFNGVTSALRVPSDATTKLPPGTTVLARDLNPPELDFVDTAGRAVVPAIKMPFAAAGQELRKLERNPKTGNFSLTRYESGTAAYIYEVTEQGQQVAKIRLPTGAKGYNALWRDGGGMIATTGSLASVITIDANGAVISSVGGKGAFKDAAGKVVFTDFFSGFFRLANGNVVAANWLGHVNASNYPTTPELLEITPTNQLAWTWGNQSIATYITYAVIIR